MSFFKRAKERITSKIEHRDKKDEQRRSESAAEAKVKDQKDDQAAVDAPPQKKAGPVDEENSQRIPGSRDVLGVPDDTVIVDEAAATTRALHASENTENSSIQQAEPRSLWDIAYANFENLNEETKGLVEDYETILQKGLETTEDGHEPPATREVQLQKIIQAGAKKQEEDEIRVGLFGKTLSLTAATTKFVGLVIFFKDFVSEAVKASPEASLAWAGVSLMIPILTMPETAKQANSAGLTKITLRMQYFVTLERLMLRSNQRNEIEGDRDEVVERFKENLEILYRQIIEFQIRSVLLYHERRARRLWNVYFESVDWSGMVDSIKELEEKLTVEQTTLSNEQMRIDLQTLKNTAESSYNLQKDMVKELRQMKDILREIAQNTQVPTSLPTAPTAIFDSRDEEDEEDNIIIPCFKGTRVQLLEDVQQWIKEPDRETLLWLHGPAGIGKSTVAYTVAEKLHQEQDLAASYFFRRGKAKRNTPGFVFPTLAKQLVRTVPEFGTHLEDALKKASGGSMTEQEIKALSLEQQFDTLIWKPLQCVSEMVAQAAAKFIVIDALDESEGPNVRNDTKVICQKLLSLQDSKTVRMRVLLTSRDTKAIVEKLGSEDISVHSIDGLADYISETKDDISAYIEGKLEHVRAEEMKHTPPPWPDAGRLERLLQMATSPSPLFIYASTLCRFVYDGTGRHQPEERLDQWLENTDSTSRLGSVYKPVIRQLVYGDERKPDRLSSKALADLTNIFSALFFLFVPLSVQSLAYLLDLTEDKLRFCLQNLHSILQVPKDSKKAVQILHTSLREYLLDTEAEAECGIKIDRTVAHHFLYLKCVEHMKENEKVAERKSKGNDRETRREAETSALGYASLYWCHHLRRGRSNETTEEEYLSSLQSYNHLWLKSLRLTGQLNTGDSAIPSYQPSNVTKLQYNISMRTPLQVYFALEGLPVIAGYLLDVANFVSHIRSQSSSSMVARIQTLSMRFRLVDLTELLHCVSISTLNADEAVSSLYKVKWDLLHCKNYRVYLGVFAAIQIIMKGIFHELHIDSLGRTVFGLVKQVQIVLAKMKSLEQHAEHLAMLTEPSILESSAMVEFASFC